MKLPRTIKTPPMMQMIPKIFMNEERPLITVFCGAENSYFCSGS